MKKRIRDRMNYRASQLSPEGRLRQLAIDLLAIVDTRDDRALQQASALAAVPQKRQKPAPPPTSVAREAALGRVVMPAQELGAATVREKALQRRREMRDRIGFEVIPDFELGRFIEEEERRWKVAGEMLRRGMSPGDVAVRCDLESDEIANIQEQLDIR